MENNDRLYKFLRTIAIRQGITRLRIGLVVRSGRGVLMHKRGRKYELPNGEIRPDEPMENAILRIAMEQGWENATIVCYLSKSVLRNDHEGKEWQYNFQVRARVPSRKGQRWKRPRAFIRRLQK